MTQHLFDHVGGGTRRNSDTGRRVTKVVNSYLFYRRTTHSWDEDSASEIGISQVSAFLGMEKRIIWEEWFLLNGELRHHVLSNHSFEQQDGVWQSEPDDTDHPLITINRKWNYKIERSLIPFLF